MAALAMVVPGLEVCSLPILGIVLMVTGKVARGSLASVANGLFFGTLLLAAVATSRSLLGGETQWLLHALALAVLIVGSVSIPHSNHSVSLASEL